MKFARNTTLVLIAATLGTAAFASTGPTREQVRAEAVEAVRTGNVASDIGPKLNELYPARYQQNRG